MAKKPEDPTRQDHGGSIAAEDEELTLWLNKLWARNEPPERIELYQMFGRNKVVRGEMIHHEDFRPNEKLNIEQANKLANELMASAQNDCNSARRESWYQLAVVDRNRRATPLVRRIGPLQPTRSHALRTLHDIDREQEADDDESLSLQALDLRRIKEANEQTRWDKSRYDRLAEGMFLLQHHIIQNQQAQLDKLMNQSFAAYEKLQESLDRQVQRDIILEEKRFSLGMKKELIRTARNLLPGFFGAGQGGQQQENNGSAPDKENGVVVHPRPTNQPAAVDYGPSPERALVTNFLNDIEEDGEEISIALFGDFKAEDGKLVQVKPGIFTEEQFKILLGVRAGHMPVTKLDELIPDWGHANAVGFEQIQAASAAGLTEGVAMALLEIVGLRKQARAAAEAAAAPKPSTPSNSPSA